MKTIDFMLPTDILKRNWKAILIAFLLLFIFFQCNRTKDLMDNADVHKRNADNYLNQARAIKNQINIDKSKFADTIDYFKSEELKKENDIALLKKQVNRKIADVKHYNSTDIENYFKDKYQLPQYVKTTTDGTCLKDTVSRLVITDLVKGDGYKSENLMLNGLVALEKNKNNESLRYIYKLQSDVDSMSANYENANSEKDKAIDNVEKSLKKEKNKKNFYKITTGLGILTSIFLLVTK